MINNFDSVREKFLADLQLLNWRMDRTQSQISSGVRVSKPSDDPGAVTDILQIEFDLSSIQQATSNLNSVKGEVDTADGVLSNASQLLDQVRALGAQGASGTQSATARATLANQVEQILSQLVNISRTTYSGQYLFSGDQSGSPAYQLNLSSPTGVDRLQNGAATKLVADGNGGTFAVRKTAADIFDARNADDTPAAGNVFNAVNSLRLALVNNDQGGITAALDSLRSAQDWLSLQQGFYGAAQQRITSALDAAQQLQAQWQGTLSSLRDTDIAAASTDLASERLTQQAALQAQSSYPRTSLFDYLK